jgi:peptide chain release factor 1
VISLSKERELLFSVGPKNFKIEFFKAGGKGGQNRNKRDTACRITHPDSGAVGYSCDERSQHQNKIKAFERLINSKEFQTWHKRKCAELLMETEKVKERINKELNNSNLTKIEIKDENDRWVETV